MALSSQTLPVWFYIFASTYYKVVVVVFSSSLMSGRVECDVNVISSESSLYRLFPAHQTPTKVQPALNPNDGEKSFL